ncbi:hypothetical protein N3K66_006604 [Trichothecium roseum]|uniref:Uncharacterized protein n=1 Tax=Trichothecium roseum TaxID=47278 RepID=A0ACC0UVY9_9HYPO|nr:hypothetical protein N3K66_006604 [Trichothecium roseum]
MSGEVMAESGLSPEIKAMLNESAPLPFKGVTHVRQVPQTSSYFTREPRFNDMHIELRKLLTQYHHLPTVRGNDAPQLPWMKVEHVRQALGEPIKASYFSQVLRIAKRLNQIDPSLRPPQVDVAIQPLTRGTEMTEQRPNPIAVDKYGRAVGVGRRKESTARAFVVEGTGEFQVNGKSLAEVFGRAHDRESAAWALTATQRLDKYNVWCLVEGGGITGQAEAITLAVAKGLIAHEPALKTFLRKAGCVSRDYRTVERKKHGRKKARKGMTWVKR